MSDTPTQAPWQLGLASALNICDSKGSVIASAHSLADAKLIVNARNSYDTLERELAEAKARIAELEAANGAARPCRGESTQTMNTETNPTKTDGSTALAVDACYALLWIHTHYQTGEPLQIDVTEWNGRVDVLEQLTDDAKISDLDLTGLKREDWIHVRVEYSLEETDYSLRLFPHNAELNGGLRPSV